MEQKTKGGIKMDDQMAVLLILIMVFLYAIYRFSKGGGYSGEIQLNPGTYRIGEDLSPGKGDLVAVSGCGEICIQESSNGIWSNNFKLHASDASDPARFRNLTLRPHDILEINGNIQVMITPSTPITDPENIEIGLGVYQFGLDVPPAKYNLKAVSGDGHVTFFEPEAEEFSFFQSMNASGDGKSKVYENVLCEEGSRMLVDGALVLKLTKSKKQRGRMQKALDFLNQDA